MNVRFAVAAAAVAAVATIAVPLLRSESAAKKDAILLCDGKTQVVVPQLNNGKPLDRSSAQNAADRMMTAWLDNRPGTHWTMPATSNLAVFAMQQSTQELPQAKQHEVYNRDSPADEFVRQAELTKFIAEGDRIFHDASAFGGTVGISCDMCHPGPFARGSTGASNIRPKANPSRTTTCGSAQWKLTAWRSARACRWSPESAN